MKTKRAEIGTSTLIILIATIITVSAILFAIFNQLDFLGSTSYKNLKLSNNYISKGVNINIIEAADGRNNYFDEFYVIIQILPDSQQINFDQTVLSIQTKDSSALLMFRNGTPSYGPGGYETFATDKLLETTAAYDHLQNPTVQFNAASFTSLVVDIDGDGVTDEVASCDGTLCPAQYDDVAIVFNLSSAGLQFVLLNDTTGSLVDISPGGAVPMDLDYAPIGDVDDPYGFVTMYDTKPNFLPHTIVADASTGPLVIYTSPVKLANDLDRDGEFDYLVANSSHVRVFPSSEKVSIDVPLGADISGSAVTLGVLQDLVLSNGTAIGSINITGSAANGVFDESVIKIIPQLSEVGFYQVEYLTLSEFHQTDRLVRGEVAKVYVDSPYKMKFNDEIRFDFIVSDGVSFPVTAFTGHTIRGQQVATLYPQI